MILLLAAEKPSYTEPDPRPVVDDPIVMQMRPSGRRIGLLRVGAAQEYATISGAVDAAHAIISDRKAAEGMAGKETTPNYRVDILIDPGEYIEAVTGVNDWVALYAADGVKGSVVVSQPTGVGGLPLGVLTTSSGCYVEGLHIVRKLDSANGNPKYPIHHAMYHTAIFTRCILDNEGSTSGGVTTIGTDGGPNGTTILHDVDLISGGTNQHGWESTTAGHQTVVYSQVSSPNGAVNWNAMNDVAPDECWVVGGNVQHINVAGASSILHRDPATVVSGSVTATTLDNRVDWPVPAGGLSAWDRTHFGM